MSEPVLKVAILAPYPDFLEYLPPEHFEDKQIQPGIRVQVPLKNRVIQGIIVAVSDNQPSFPLRRVLKLEDRVPILPANLLSLICWAARYYCAPPGETIFSLLPRKIAPEESSYTPKKTTPRKSIPSEKAVPHLSNLALNLAQQEAIETLSKMLDCFQVFLLEGVTGSGKTEVYLQIIAKIISQKRQVLILVPEIALTPQLMQRFHQRFPHHVGILHSQLNEKKRWQTWQDASLGNILIIIGTRLAVFTPFKALGLIIIDEEHDPSFKQQERFRYSARDVALMYAKQSRVPIILGSATPMIETLYHVLEGYYRRLYLPYRASGSPPLLKLLDVRRQKKQGIVSRPLLDKMAEHISQQHQVLLFLNRRGFSPLWTCPLCGWMALCPHCDAKLVFHQQIQRLRCHHCQWEQEVTSTCPQCSDPDGLQPLGSGTERIEIELRQVFPDANIARIDRDTTRKKGTLQEILHRVAQGEVSILIGTQMIAKGHHFPNMTLVGILDADYGLFSNDFRASERLAQMITQVSGRAGRGDAPGEVLIQTSHPQHALWALLLRRGYDAFAWALLAERQLAGWPPFSRLALLRAESVRLEACHLFLAEAKTLAENIREAVQLLGPVPALMEKKAGRYRYHLLIRAAHRTVLQKFIQHWLPALAKIKPQREIRWTLDIDPQETA